MKHLLSHISIVSSKNRNVLFSSFLRNSSNCLLIERYVKKVNIFFDRSNEIYSFLNLTLIPQTTSFAQAGSISHTYKQEEMTSNPNLFTFAGKNQFQLATHRFHIDVSIIVFFMIIRSCLSFFQNRWNYIGK